METYVHLSPTRKQRRGERNDEWEKNRDERANVQERERERPPLGESSPCAHNTVIVYKVPFVQVPPGGGGWGSSRRRQLELREDEAVSGAGKHTRRACQSSSDKGSYWDESSTEEEEDVGAADVAGAAEASDDEGPPDATLLPTGLLGATAMERTDSAENGYAYVVGKGCGGGGGADG